MIEILKTSGFIAVIFAVMWFIVKFFVIAPIKLKEHEQKHKEHEKRFDNHSLKISTLEANDLNREKVIDRIHETLTLLNSSIIKLTEKL